MVVHFGPLSSKTKKSGLYIISPQNEDAKQFRMKIGMSCNLARRLNEYNVCSHYQEGFYILGLLVFTAREGKANVSFVYGMEHKFFQYIERKYRSSHQTSLRDLTGSREVYLLTANEARDALNIFASLPSIAPHVKEIYTDFSGQESTGQALRPAPAARGEERPSGRKSYFYVPCGSEEGMSILELRRLDKLFVAAEAKAQAKERADKELKEAVEAGGGELRRSTRARAGRHRANDMKKLENAQVGRKTRINPVK